MGAHAKSESSQGMSQRICSGDGSCLEQTGYSNIYKKYENINCNHDCKPIKCPNYDVCENKIPQWLLWCHHNLCPHCGMFGLRLEFSDNLECPVCMETKQCVKQMKCDHKICVDCFKRCHFPPYWRDPQPQFPYSGEIEDEYDNDSENPKWLSDPLIQKYLEDSERWEIERNIKEDSEKYLKVCPLCRK